MPKLTAPSLDAARVYSDSPLTDTKHDLLDRKQEAERLARIIEQMTSQTDSSVAGLVGGWGTGKTTLLNFTKQHIITSNKIQIVEFSPWMLSDLQSLVTDFFATINSGLTGKNGDRAREAISTYVNKLAPFGDVFQLVGFNAGELAKVVASCVAPDNSLAGLKTRVERSLKKVEKPILVVVDDLDRLHPDELLPALKLIRLIGNLPQVHYMVAYDETALIGTLTNTDLAKNSHKQAAEYLEKMVQIKLRVPPIAETARKRVLFQWLKDIDLQYGKHATPEDWNRLEDFDKEHFRPTLTQLRQIKRYIRQVRAYYPALQGEVEFSDFAIIMYLHTIYPTVFDLLVTHRDELVNEDLKAEFRDKSDQRELWETRVQEAVDSSEHRAEEALDVLGRLFVPIDIIINDTAYQKKDPVRLGPYARELPDGKRVGNFDHIDRYLRFGFGPDDIRDTDVHAAVLEASNGSPADRWNKMSDFLAVSDENARRVIQKVKRSLKEPGLNKSRLLLPLIELEQYIPPSDNLDNPTLKLRSLLAEIITDPTTKLPSGLDQHWKNSTGVRSLAFGTQEGVLLLQKRNTPPSNQFTRLLMDVGQQIEQELLQQIRQAPQTGQQTRKLIVAWCRINPKRPQEFFTQQLREPGTWHPADFAAVLWEENPNNTTAQLPEPHDHGDVKLINTILGTQNLISMTEAPDVGTPTQRLADSAAKALQYLEKSQVEAPNPAP